MKETLLSVCVMHPKECNLSLLISRIPKGSQIVSCVIEQVDEYDEQFELIADTPNIVSLKYKYKSYGIDFDFAAIRNEMDSYAAGQWVLHIDSDEYLANHPDDVIDEILAMEKEGCVAGWTSIAGITFDKSDGKHVRERYALHSCRLFKKNSGINWEGICHEVPVTNGEQLPFHDTNIILIHDGYMIDNEGFEHKAERNGKLLIREYTRNPSKRVWNYLVKTFSNMKLEE